MSLVEAIYGTPAGSSGRACGAPGCGHGATERLPYRFADGSILTVDACPGHAKEARASGRVADLPRPRVAHLTALAEDRPVRRPAPLPPPAPPESPMVTTPLPAAPEAAPVIPEGACAAGARCVHPGAKVVARKLHARCYDHATRHGWIDEVAPPPKGPGGRTPRTRGELLATAPTPAKVAKKAAAPTVRRTDPYDQIAEIVGVPDGTDRQIVAAVKRAVSLSNLAVPADAEMTTLLADIPGDTLTARVETLLRWRGESLKREAGHEEALKRVAGELAEAHNAQREAAVWRAGAEERIRALTGSASDLGSVLLVLDEAKALGGENDAPAARLRALLAANASDLTRREWDVWSALGEPDGMWSWALLLDRVAELVKAERAPVRPALERDLDVLEAQLKTRLRAVTEARRLTLVANGVAVPEPACL